MPLETSIQIVETRILHQRNCVHRLISIKLLFSVFSAETISSVKMSINISDTLQSLYFVKKMSEHQYA